MPLIDSNGAELESQTEGRNLEIQGQHDSFPKYRLSAATLVTSLSVHIPFSRDIKAIIHPPPLPSMYIRVRDAYVADA